MRVMVKANIPTATGNAAIKNGTMGPTLAKVIEALKPEAVLHGRGGHADGLHFLDLKEPSDIPKSGEPLFLELDAQVTITPAMTFEELGQGIAKWDN